MWSLDPLGFPCAGDRQCIVEGRQPANLLQKQSPGDQLPLEWRSQKAALNIQ